MPKRGLEEFVYDYLADEVEEVFKRRIPDYIRSGAFQVEYTKKKVYETLRWVISDWRMNLVSEGWEFIYQTGGINDVQEQLKQIATRIYDYAIYYIEKDFGYSEESIKYPPEIHELAQKLDEFLQRYEDMFFGQWNQDVRASEFIKAKILVRKLNNDILKWILMELSRAGFR